MFKEFAATLIHLAVENVDILGEDFEPDFDFEALESFHLDFSAAIQINEKVIEVVKGSKKTLRVLQCVCDDFSSFTSFKNLETISLNGNFGKVK
jgi:hypothetical protein